VGALSAGADSLGKSALRVPIVNMRGCIASSGGAEPPLGSCVSGSSAAGAIADSANVDRFGDAVARGADEP
jgi:hypothetical protein